MEVTGTRKRRQGFTLIELMVVLAILGLLFALVGPNIFKQQAGAKVDVTKIQIKKLNQALEMFSNTEKKYPAALKELAEKKYLTGEVPQDPWGQDYVYEPAYSDDGDRVVGYNLFSMGPDRRKDTPDDIGNKRMEKKDIQ